MYVVLFIVLLMSMLLIVPCNVEHHSVIIAFLRLISADKIRSCAGACNISHQSACVGLLLVHRPRAGAHVGDFTAKKDSGVYPCVCLCNDKSALQLRNSL